MGRAKLAMEYIQNAKARRSTFERRKIGLKKKAYELSTLCDVPVCVVVFPEGTTSDSNSQPWIYPEDKNEAKSIMDRYVSLLPEIKESEEKNSKFKRRLDLQDMIQGKRRKIENSTNWMPNCPNWMPNLDGLSRDQLLDLGSVLDYKLNWVQERIDSERQWRSRSSISLLGFDQLLANELL